MKSAAMIQSPPQNKEMESAAMVESPPQNKEHTLFLSGYKSLAVVKTEHTLIAKITNTVTGQFMTLGQKEMVKLIHAMSFAFRHRENLLTEAEKNSLAEEATFLTPKKPVKRKLTFTDSPIIISSSEEQNSTTSSPIPPSGLPLYTGFYEDAQERFLEFSDSDMEEEEEETSV